MRSPGCAPTARLAAAARRERPIVLSVLHRVFVQGNARVISAADMEALLADDELYAIRQLSPGSLPKPARDYLYDWARLEAGWLHKYYPDGTNEPQFKS
jgi:Protein of unknown function (DUF3375)